MNFFFIAKANLTIMFLDKDDVSTDRILKGEKIIVTRCVQMKMRQAFFLGN